MSIKDKFKNGDIIKNDGDIRNPEDIWIVVGWVNDPEEGDCLMTRFINKPEIVCLHAIELVEGMIKVNHEQ